MVDMQYIGIASKILRYLTAYPALSSRKLHPFAQDARHKWDRRCHILLERGIDCLDGTGNNPHPHGSLSAEVRFYALSFEKGTFFVAQMVREDHSLERWKYIFKTSSE